MEQRRRPAIPVAASTLEAACAGLDRAYPHRSARRVFYIIQIAVLLALTAAMVWSLSIAPQLAQVLTNSQSCEQNLARARSLCGSVQKAYNAGEDVFVNPESHIDFLRLKARLWCESTLREDRLHAVRWLEEAVVKGSGLAALHLSHYYSEQPRNTPPDIYTGVVQPNTERAMHYFLLALQLRLQPQYARVSQERALTLSDLQPG